MNSGYLVFLASQPVGQVLLQKADSVISFLQPFLEKLQPTGCGLEGVTATVESELKPEKSLPASYTSELLKKASGISSWLVSTMVCPTSRAMVTLFKEGKNVVEKLKSMGVQLMEEKSVKESAPQPLVIRVFWKPVECVWRYINKISRPYVTSEPKTEEIKLVKTEDDCSLTQQPASAPSILEEPESLDLVREDQPSAGDKEYREVEPAAGPETTAATSLEDISSVAEPETSDTTVPVQSDLEHQQPHSRDSRTDSKFKAFFKFGKKLYN